MQPKTEVVRLRVTPDFKDKIQAAAKAENRTVSNYIETAIIAKMEESMKNVEMIENLLEEEMRALNKENLYETIANSDGTMDLRFDVKGETVWVKGAPVPDDIDEFYWDDDDHVRKAVESGQNKI